MYKNYYYISKEVLDVFTELEHSKVFDSVNNTMVAKIDDFSKIEHYFNNNKTNNFFAYEIVDSLVSLHYEGVDYDDDDNEIESNCFFDKNVINDWGLVNGIEQELGLSKEQNIAYVIYKLCEHYKENPIEFANNL